ncbi:uncharacterized protein STEHIDRAFT_166740 [Stereum hirsutum FP-91666 SS1]|uniref:uncharacterized protein n=1 Tax=Stereum hirsutum (strain FP-91666) TaxID=721885 RepID=UPI000440EA85|nr:uncharacterized protein STEHIDRAFT_166740 [Stereum hirsutum FP-91666 SS1]EIM88721.1 hypothetical protein STEHIDRAFT_166740 [Stereum hirsutum FP-91666 SS1]
MASRTEVSPGRRKNTVSEQISALGAMLTRVLSSGEPADASTTPATTTRGRDRHPAGAEGGDDDGRSQADTVDEIQLAKEKAKAQERSTSRGRQFQSSGRGGLGNILPRRSPSPSRSPSRARAHVDGPDDFSNTRGREPRSALSIAATSQPISIGRGGAGNIRSPSRPRETAGLGYTYAAEEELSYVPTIARGRSEESRTPAVRSSGRGGIGNIRACSPSRSPANTNSSIPDRSPTRSRSRSRGPQAVSANTIGESPELGRSRTRITVPSTLPVHDEEYAFDRRTAEM